MVSGVPSLICTRIAQIKTSPNPYIHIHIHIRPVLNSHTDNSGERDKIRMGPVFLCGRYLYSTYTILIQYLYNTHTILIQYLYSTYSCLDKHGSLVSHLSYDGQRIDGLVGLNQAHRRFHGY